MTVSSTDKPRKPNRPLTTAQRAEAIALWESGNTSLSDLEERFKKDRTTFLRLFKEAGVEKGSKAADNAAKVTAAVQDALVQDATVLAGRIRETKEEHYKMAAGAAKLAWSIVAEAKRGNVPLATVGNDLKAIKTLMEIEKIAREERYAVLGISADDDNEDKPLPDLVVQELTAEDIKQMHLQQMMEQQEELSLGSDDFALLGDEGAVDALADDRVETDGEDDE